MKQKSTDFEEQFERHISYIKETAGAVSLPPDRERVLTQSIRRVLNRLRNRTVRIAVAGEFSSGKSSVINALLGEDLLEVDELPDTTLIPTLISYSDTPKLNIAYKNGKLEPYLVTSTDDIKAVLKKYSVNVTLYDSGEETVESSDRVREAVDRIAGEILLIHIGIPSSFLQTGIELYDTPGLNSLNSRCAETTREVLRSCDAAIIIGNAVRGGLLEDFRCELEKSLSSRIPDSVVVYTHMDSITNRDKTIRFLKGITPGYFNLSHDTLPVMFMVSPAVLQHNKVHFSQQEHFELRDMTEKTMDYVLSHFNEKFSQIRHRALYVRVNWLYYFLGSSVMEMIADYSHQIDSLREELLSPAEFKSLMQIYLDRLDREISEIKAELIMLLDNVASEIRRETDRRISTCDNLEELQACFDALPKYLENKAEEASMAALMALKRVEESKEILYKEFYREISNRVKGMDFEFIFLFRDVTSEGKIEHCQKQFVSRCIDACLLISNCIPSYAVSGIGNFMDFLVGKDYGTGRKSLVMNNVLAKIDTDYRQKLIQLLDDYNSDMTAIFNQASVSASSDFMKLQLEYLSQFENNYDQMYSGHTDHIQRLKEQIEYLNSKLDEIKSHKEKLT